MKAENFEFEGRPTFPRPTPHFPKKIALEEAVSTSVFEAAFTVPRYKEASELTYTSSEFNKDVERRLTDIDLRVKSMDETGIDISVLSLTMPGIEGVADPILAVEYARKVNDEIYETYVTGKYSNRFRAFACVAMQNPEAAAAEAKRAVKELGAVGVLINGYSNIGDANTVQYLDEPQCEPFWAAIEELDVPVYLHPRIASPSQLRAYQGLEFFSGSPFGFQVETAVHAMRLILSGLFDRHPNLKLLLGHCGEGLPVSLPRTDARLRHFRKDQIAAKESLQYYWDKNVWVTTAGIFNDNTFNETLNFCGSDKVLFSVDYPYESNEEIGGWFDGLDIAPSTRAKVGWENAVKLLKL